MHRDITLDPATLPPAQVEILERARIGPMGPGRDMPSGVFRADGSFVEASRTLISLGRFSGTPSRPADTEVRRLRGRHLYAGIGRHHFGHFLMEGIGRLWPLDALHDDIDGILVTPMHAKDIEAIMRRRLLPFYSLLSRGKPIWLIDHPAEVDELIVPTQGFGHLDWSTGSPEFRAFIRKRIADSITPDGPERIYVSRTKLKSPDQQVDQEANLQRKLKRAGYTIFHPQRHTLEEQCQVYMAAREILGTDGSAFHLAPFALQPGTRVGLIQRRHRQELFDALAAQITAFADVDLTTFNTLLPRGKTDLPLAEPDPMDMQAVLKALRGAGFL